MESETEIIAQRGENDELKDQLREALETLDAIGRGDVDAILVGERVYTLQSADIDSNRFRGEVLSQISDVVIAVENESRLIYINSAAESQYGVKAADVLGRKLSDVYAWRWTAKEDEASSQASIREKGSWRGENIHTKLNGEEINVESIITRMSHLDGSAAGYLAVIRDISDRKRAEEELRHAHEILESRVRDRTAELAKANAALKAEIGEHVKTEQQRSELVHKLVTMQEDERSRIARDIHDQLGQRVTALRLQIASMLGLDHSEQFAGRLQRLQKTAQALDAEIGSLAREVRPTSLDDLGLVTAARAFLEDWSEQFEVAVQFIARGIENERLDPEIETHLYRIMQESLNNVVKHANAKRVNVLLERRGAKAALIVEDDGKGFDPDDVLERSTGKHQGIGLLGMRERAALVGGDLQIESAKGAGTTVFASVPASMSA